MLPSLRRARRRWRVWLRSCGWQCEGRPSWVRKRRSAWRLGRGKCAAMDAAANEQEHRSNGAFDPVGSQEVQWTCGFKGEPSPGGRGRDPTRSTTPGMAGEGWMGRDPSTSRRRRRSIRCGSRFEREGVPVSTGWNRGMGTVGARSPSHRSLGGSRVHQSDARWGDNPVGGVDGTTPHPKGSVADEDEHPNPNEKKKNPSSPRYRPVSIPPTRTVPRTGLQPVSPSVPLRSMVVTCPLTLPGTIPESSAPSRPLLVSNRPYPYVPSPLRTSRPFSYPPRTRTPSIARPPLLFGDFDPLFSLRLQSGGSDPRRVGDWSQQVRLHPTFHTVAQARFTHVHASPRRHLLGWTSPEAGGEARPRRIERVEVSAGTKPPRTDHEARDAAGGEGRGGAAARASDRKARPRERGRSGRGWEENETKGVGTPASRERRSRSIHNHLAMITSNFEEHAKTLLDGNRGEASVRIETAARVWKMEREPSRRKGI